MTYRYQKVLRYHALLFARVLYFWRFAAFALTDRISHPAGDFTRQFGVFRDAAYRSPLALAGIVRRASKRPGA